MCKPDEIIFYVAENGNDDNAGSKEAPFATVCAALKSLAGSSCAQAVIIISGTITEVADVAAMITVTGELPPLLIKGESPKRKGILDAAGLGKRVLSITGGNKVTLGPGLVLKGGFTDQLGGSGVYVDGGDLILDGAKIMENETRMGLCGGVYVGKNSTFVMKSGCITKNSSLFNGGGVFPDEDGEFIMYGGSITDNTALIAGAGVFVGVDGSFTMYDGLIDGNMTGGEEKVLIGGIEIPCGKGGGVFVSERGEFTMHGGKISNNRSISLTDGDNSGCGGGVFIEGGGVFTQEDGIILKNGAMNLGAGVYTEGKYTMKKGRVSNNISRVGGGGICVAGKDALAVLEDGEIVVNYGGAGGAVYTREEGVFRMENGIIADNTGTEVTTLFIDGIVSMLGGIIHAEGEPKLPDVRIDKKGKFFAAGGILKAKVEGEGVFEDLRKK